MTTGWLEILAPFQTIMTIAELKTLLGDNDSVKALSHACVDYALSGKPQQDVADALNKLPAPQRLIVEVLLQQWTGRNPFKPDPSAHWINPLWDLKNAIQRFKTQTVATFTDAELRTMLQEIYEEILIRLCRDAITVLPAN
jgi:hypothetical protein